MSPKPVVRSRSHLRFAVGLLVAAMGCSGLDAPTGVTTDDALLPNAVSSSKAVHDSLMDLAAAERDRIHREKDERKEEFSAAKKIWQAFRKEIAEAKKKKHAYEIDMLRCEPQEYAGDAQVIGPNGGSIHVGKHELKIPKGALDHEVVISGEAPVSELVEVELEPHGLTFARPAELKLNYDQCVVPTNLNLFIVYLGNNGQVLEIRPSVDKKGLDTVVGDLDHFSRYAVAW